MQGYEFWFATSANSSNSCIEKGASFGADWVFKLNHGDNAASRKGEKSVDEEKEDVPDWNDSDDCESSGVSKYGVIGVIGVPATSKIDDAGRGNGDEDEGEGGTLI